MDENLNILANTENIANIDYFCKNYPEFIQELFQNCFYLSKHPSFKILNYLLYHHKKELNTELCNPIAYSYHIKREDLIELFLYYGFTPNLNECNLGQELVEKNDEKYIVRFLEGNQNIFNTIHLNLIEKTNNKKIHKLLFHYEYPIPRKYDMKSLQDIPLIKSSDFNYISIKDELDIDMDKNNQVDETIQSMFKPKEPFDDYSLEDDISPLSFTDSFKDTIILYYPSILYNELCTRYWTTHLFYYDNSYWNSVEQYLYYVLYKDNDTLANIIQSIQCEEKMNQFRQLIESATLDPNCIWKSYENKFMFTEEQVHSIVENKKTMIHKKCYTLLEKITKIKLEQNPSIQNILLHTGSHPIINKDVYDRFGYVNNNLGRFLTEYKHTVLHISTSPLHNSNNLFYHIYQANPKFYIVRGNPDKETSEILKKLGTFHNKNGKITKGKYCTKLRGGPGWLIPVHKQEELNLLLYQTYPLLYKVSFLGKQWLKRKLTHILLSAEKLRHAQNKEEITNRIMKFIIQDLYQSNSLISENKSSFPLSFSIFLCEQLTMFNIRICYSAQELLWEYLYNMFSITFQNDITADDMKDTITSIDDLFYKTVQFIHPSNPDLDTLVHLFLVSFNRLFPLVHTILHDTKIACLTLIDILIGTDNYSMVRQKYKSKLKQDRKGKYDSNALMYQERFQISIHHIDYVLKAIPTTIEKKCRLLLLTTIEYLENIQDQSKKDELLKFLFITS